MKKFYPLCLLLAMSFSFILPYAQGQRISRADRKNIVRQKPFRNVVKETDNLLELKRNPTVKSGLLPTETQIGETRYDLQTNQSVQNRIVRYADGTMAAIWTRGMTDPGFSERGTGYNYFDGTNWGAMPSARIETQRTGWPSLDRLGDGEIVVAHHNTAGLVVASRPLKGTGAWTESILPGPAGAVDISWPRMVTSGTNRNVVHVIATTYVPYQGMDLPLLYYRSTDGGITWDKNHVILPGISSAEYLGFGGDSYAFAEPKGDTLAFVVGDNWTDVILMKSTDGGENWTKKVVFQHPYPFFRETSTLVLDTPTVTDGSVAIALDNNGKAHIAFGLMRVLNSDTTDGETSYFPYSDGLAYWNEDMPTLTSVRYEDLESQGLLAGFTPDLNGNDTILEFDDLGTYFLSVTSMPNISIDDGNRIFLVMTSVMENISNGSQNYRHILARMSTDMGASWSDFVDVTGGILHNFTECVFPSVAASSDNNIHIVYQEDDEPGLAVRGDIDPYGDNKIKHISLPKADLGIGIGEQNNTALTVSAYPNPIMDRAYIIVTLSKPSVLGIEVFDMFGKKVYERASSDYGQGTHYFQFNRNGLASGMYFYTVKAGNQAITQKLIIN